MNDGNLITLSKVDAKSNNHVERKSFTNVDIATSVAFALFVGTTALKSTADLDALFGYDFIMPSYIQYINSRQSHNWLQRMDLSKFRSFPWCFPDWFQVPYPI